VQAAVVRVVVLEDVAVVETRDLLVAVLDVLADEQRQQPRMLDDALRGAHGLAPRQVEAPERVAALGGDR